MFDLCDFLLIGREPISTRTDTLLPYAALCRSRRSRILRSLELAERQADPHRRAERMTSVIVGARPTGVEMAVAIAELAHYTLARDFRHIDPGAVRILLVEAGKQILASFPDRLSTSARRRLEAMAVEIDRTSTRLNSSH